MNHTDNTTWKLYSSNQNKIDKQKDDEQIDREWLFAMKQLFRTAIQAAKIDVLAKKYNV